MLNADPDGINQDPDLSFENTKKSGCGSEPQENLKLNPALEKKQFVSFNAKVNPNEILILWLINIDC